jgi:hypothetical protein
MKIHGHHIVMKGAFAKSPRMRAAVEESRVILAKAGITDPTNDLKNLTYALNWDHSIEYAESVMKRLQKAEADSLAGLGAIDELVEGALNDIGKVLGTGKKYRYP